MKFLGIIYNNADFIKQWDKEERGGSFLFVLTTRVVFWSVHKDAVVFPDGYLSYLCTGLHGVMWTCPMQPPLCVSPGLPPLIAFDTDDFWKTCWRNGLNDTLPGYGGQRHVGFAWRGKESSSYLAKPFCLGNENKHLLLIVIKEVHALLLSDWKDFFPTLKLQKPQNPTFSLFCTFCSKKLTKDWDCICFFSSASGSDG